MGKPEEEEAAEPEWNGPTIGDGEADPSGIGPATPHPTDLLNRLPRQLRAPFPPVSPVDDRRLPTVDPHATDISPEHRKRMMQELGKRLGAQSQILALGKGVRLPPGHDDRPDPPTKDTSKDWVGRPSDVLVAVPAKSGTTFTQHICHQLRVRGKEPIDFDDMMQARPRPTPISPPQPPLRAALMTSQRWYGR